jgi:hypothetical protein
VNIGDAVIFQQIERKHSRNLCCSDVVAVEVGGRHHKVQVQLVSCVAAGTSGETGQNADHIGGARPGNDQSCGVEVRFQVWQGGSAEHQVRSGKRVDAGRIKGARETQEDGEKIAVPEKVKGWIVYRRTCSILSGLLDYSGHRDSVRAQVCHTSHGDKAHKRKGAAQRQVSEQSWILLWRISVAGGRIITLLLI